MVKEVNCVVTDDKKSCDGDHFVVYTEVELCCIFETYIYI